MHFQLSWVEIRDKPQATPSLAERPAHLFGVRVTLCSATTANSMRLSIMKNLTGFIDKVMFL